MDVKNDMVVGDQYPGVGIQTRHNSAIGPLFVHRPLYPSSGDQTFSESEPGDGSMNVARFARSGRILKVHLLGSTFTRFPSFPCLRTWRTTRLALISIMYAIKTGRTFEVCGERTMEALRAKEV